MSDAHKARWGSLSRPAIWRIGVEIIALTWLLLADAQAATSQEELLKSAAEEVKRGDCVTAARFLRKVLESDSGSAVAYNLSGICLAQAGDIDLARSSFEKAIELNAQLVSARLNLGRLLVRMHEEAAAIQQFKAAIGVDPEILTRDPTSYSSFNIFGLCLMSDGKYEEAREAFERAMRINPKYVPAQVNLGNALVALHHDGDALKQFLQVIAVKPNDFLALKNAGLIYGRQEKFELAIEYLRNAQAVVPRDREIGVALAGSEISAGHALEAKRLIGDLLRTGDLTSSNRQTLALVLLEKDEPQSATELVRADPVLATEFYKSAYERAEAEFDRGGYQKARKILEAIHGLRTPDAAFHDLMGSVYYGIDDPKEASDEFQEAVRLEPADPEHYFKLGMVFLKHRTAEPAIYIFQTALGSRPDASKLWLGLGLSYYLASRLDEAEPALRKAVALDPNYESAYVVLADLLEQSRRTADALDIVRKAMEVQPDLYWPYYFYGKLVSKEGQQHRADAIAKLRKAVSLNPSFSEARYELGKALAQADQNTEAIQELKKSLELNPDLAQAHYQLARIYKKMDDQKRLAEEVRLFDETNKKAKPEDIIQRLEVQIEPTH